MEFERIAEPNKTDPGIIKKSYANDKRKKP